MKIIHKKNKSTVDLQELVKNTGIDGVDEKIMSGRDCDNKDEIKLMMDFCMKYIRKELLLQHFED